LAWIFTHTGRLPSEILSLPPGERAICMRGAIWQIERENKRVCPLTQLKKY